MEIVLEKKKRKQIIITIALLSIGSKSRRAGQILKLEEHKMLAGVPNLIIIGAHLKGTMYGNVDIVTDVKKMSRNIVY